MKKLSFKAKRAILGITAVLFALILIIFYKFLTTSLVGISILVLFLIAYSILTFKWWRCPHCDTYLWKLPPFAKHCPYCSNPLE